jgi:hypothetical protein
MKSLEIIKRKINEIYGFDDKWEEVEELETIKQDLEVLEIIRKNTYRRDYNSLEPSITFIVPSWLSKEDFNKVKQWLEENENEQLQQS